jgi:hypothetical protein
MKDIVWEVEEEDGAVLVRVAERASSGELYGSTLHWEHNELKDARAFADAFYAALRKAGG